MTVYALADYLAGGPVPDTRPRSPFHATEERSPFTFAKLCACVVQHAPVPLELHRHHIWPKYLGGPTEPWNVLMLCPNAHANAHELLRYMVRNGGALSPAYVRGSSFYVRGVARAGYARWVASLPAGTLADPGLFGRFTRPQDATLAAFGV